MVYHGPLSRRTSFVAIQRMKNIFSTYLFAQHWRVWFQYTARHNHIFKKAFRFFISIWYIRNIISSVGSFYHILALKMDKVLLLMITLSVAATTASDNSSVVQKYLETYGYVSNISQTDFSTALSDFQERYNLPVDGTLNNETMNLIARPRCQHGENEYRVSTKWNKTHLRWYLSPYPRNSYKGKDYDEYLVVLKKAFQMWENASVLTFEMVSKSKSDITISFAKLDHQFRSSCMGATDCNFPFDGPGTVLSHAYFPHVPNICREIHFDSEESWYTGFGETPSGYTNLLMTAVHEIGHSLGLAHSDTENAIMFPWYQEQFRPIHHDDINGLEALYGRKNRFAPIPKSSQTTTTPITSTTTTHKSAPIPRTTNRQLSPNKPSEFIRNLCEVKSPPDLMFLAYTPGFPNYRLYIIVKNLLWKIDITTEKTDKLPVPENLENYLPEELQTAGVNHIFQTGYGNLLVAAKNNRFYSSSFPNVQIDRDVDIPQLPTHAKINAFFQAYSGKSYLFYDNTSFIEFNNVDINAAPAAIINRGRIKDAFPDVPNDITSAFRYIDGHLYFFKGNTYFKYNEFQRKLIEVGDFNWNIFDITCPSSKLLDDLKNMLSKLISFYE